MTKAKISEYDAVAANNTDVNGVNIAEGCPPSGMNNMGREIMAALKRFQTGADGDSVTVGGSLVVSNTLTAGPVSATTLTTSSTINNLTVGRGAGDVSTNTAVGASALATNTTGNNNTAVGSGALDANTTGGNNHAFGSDALGANTTGSNNCAFGRQSMVLNTTGQNNTAYGSYSLYSNTTGADNTAVGYAALDANTTGGYNAAFGEDALASNTTASYNTAVGYQAGYSQAGVGGDYNTLLGFKAGYTNSTGTQNTYIGTNAGYLTTSSYNTFVGLEAGYYITSGAKNTILGKYNGNQGGLDIRTASNYIVLSDGDGNPRSYSDNNGNWFDGGQRTITGIVKSVGVYNNTTGSAANMVSISDGQMARSTSALKYKQDIRDLESFDINKFRPVRYKSKCEMDDPTKDHIGIIADEVHDAGFTELVTYGADGEVEGFQYERLTVVLLKSLQELSAKNDALEARIAALEGN